MVKNGADPLKWLNQLVSEPYYLLHFLAFFSYFIVRNSASSFLSPQITQLLLHREIQAILAFSILVAIKSVREETWEPLVSDALFYGKLFLVGISLILDYHLALWYTLVFSVIYILTQQPPFSKLGTSSKLTPLQLEALLTEGNTSRFWLVEFCNSYSSNCVRVSRCFPELSITYSNKNLSFAMVDLGLFPNAAEKFGISLSGSMSQLPTYILFENATEITRFPEFNFELKPSHPIKWAIPHRDWTSLCTQVGCPIFTHPPPITTRLVSHHFELDRHLLQYVNGK